MYSWEQIKSMTDAEVAVANKKLVRKLVINGFFLPLAAVIATTIILNKIDSKVPNED